MKKYAYRVLIAGTPEITKVEVIAESPTDIVYRDPNGLSNSSSKTGALYVFYPTWAAARQRLIADLCTLRETVRILNAEITMKNAALAFMVEPQ